MPVFVCIHRSPEKVQANCPEKAQVERPEKAQVVIAAKAGIHDITNSL
jgi:hypothetical protein